MKNPQLYKWHRRLSLLIALPVTLWALSGFMHPIMTSFRPAVATQFLKPAPIDAKKINVPLQEVLIKNELSSIHNFRIIRIDTNWFYQVQPSVQELPVYFSTTTGKKLRNGDNLYARYLAKQFLEGQDPLPGFTTKTAAENEANSETAEQVASYDCCDAATSCVLNNEKGSKVSAVNLVTNFDEEYKFVNRLLPVYKVNFDRPDGIRIYVETTSDRFSLAVDNKRALFDDIFETFHNWEFLSVLGKWRYVIMSLLLAIAFTTACIGLYIFFNTKEKNKKDNEVVAARNRHRRSAAAVSLFTLMFTFSGAFHAASKLKPDTRYSYFTNEKIAAASLSLDTDSITKIVKGAITNISIVNLNDQLYWQVYSTPKMINKAAVSGNKAGQGEKKKRTVVDYIHTTKYTVLPEGEKMYARHLASLFSKQPATAAQSTELITKFEGEYGFVNKRLPVWRVDFDTNFNERYYVETSSGKLSVRVDDTDLLEGYSFAMFHKHHFMDWGGKELRDFSTMFWAMAQVILVVIGIMYWRKTVSKK